MHVIDIQKLIRINFSGKEEIDILNLVNIIKFFDKN